jgi:hypothetical protein
MRAILLAGILVLAACASDSSGSPSSDGATYNDMVRQIGRPPTRSATAADGGLVATWETQVQGGTRQLIVTFDKNRRVKDTRTVTVPR